MQSKQYDIFISYNRKDQEVVNEIYTYLINEDYEIWFDKNHNLYSFVTSIENGLKQSLLIMVCIGPHGIKNNTWQKKEIDAAQILSQSDQIKIISVLLPGALIDDIPLLLKPYHIIGIKELPDRTINTVKNEILELLEKEDSLKILNFIKVLRHLNFKKYKQDLQILKNEKLMIKQFILIGNEFMFYFQKLITYKLLLNKKEVEYCLIQFGESVKRVSDKNQEDKRIEYENTIKKKIFYIINRMKQVGMQHVWITIELGVNDIEYYEHIITSYNEYIQEQKVGEIINNHFWLCFFYINENVLNDSAICQKLNNESIDFRFFDKSECEDWNEHHNFDYQTDCINNFIKSFKETKNLSKHVIYELCACVLNKRNFTYDQLKKIFEILSPLPLPEAEVLRK